VAEALADDLRMRADLKGVRRVRVPEIMESDSPKALRLDPTLKRRTERARPNRLSVAREDEVDLAEVAPLGAASGAVTLQHRHRRRIERNGSSASVGLRQRDARVVVDLDKRLDDVQLRSVEIEVASAQAEELAPSETSRGGEVVSRIEAVVLRSFEEASEFGG